MALSKRERLIAIVAGAVLALLVLDHYVLTPLLTAGAKLSDERVQAVAELNKATTLFQREHTLAAKWSEMLEGGLKSDPGDAEAQLLHALQGWADQAGLEITSRKPERATEGKDVREITVQTAGTGSMAAISQFLYAIQTSKLPVRVRDLQLGTRREGTDDLSIVARISTLYVVKSKAPAKTQAPARTTEEPL
jgi:Tfp pilus assembly protein PilO